MLPHREIFRENQNRALFSAQTGNGNSSSGITTVGHSYPPCSRRRHHRLSTQRLTADLLLPPHLVVEVVKLLEEVVDLAALVVSLGGGEDADLGLLGQVFADAGDGKHDLLHGAVVTHDLGNGDGDKPQRRGTRV